MLTAGRVLSVAKRGAGSTMKTIFTIVTLASVLIGLVGLIVRAIWFRVDYGHVAVMMRNQRVKIDKKTGQPIIKEPGWRAQVPVRDDSKVVNCMERTSELKAQDLTAGDGKNIVHASAKWFVLSLRNGEQYRHYPARTLLVEDLNQEVEEILRDAIREVMANSETSASKWRSKELTKAVKRLVKQDIDRIGVRLKKVRLPEAALSEAQLHGNRVFDGFTVLSGQAVPATYQPYEQPGIHVVGS